MKRNKFPENLAGWTLTGAIAAAAAIAALAPPLADAAETGMRAQMPPETVAVEGAVRTGRRMEAQPRIFATNWTSP